MRVVGLPGDEIQLRAGVLHINGQAVPKLAAGKIGLRDLDGKERQVEQFSERLPGGNEHLVLDMARVAQDDTTVFKVPPDRYFMLGDNRDNSSDSRYWGFVSDSLLLGQPMLVYYSVVPDSVAPGSWLSRVRWQRIGEWVR